jgi:hypothetical protein
MRMSKIYKEVKYKQKNQPPRPEIKLCNYLVMSLPATPP